MHSNTNLVEVFSDFLRFSAQNGPCKVLRLRDESQSRIHASPWSFTALHLCPGADLADLATHFLMYVDLFKNSKRIVGSVRAGLVVSKKRKKE